MPVRLGTTAMGPLGTKLQEQTQGDGLKSSSVARKKRKRKSKPTGSRRSKEQNIKDRFAHAREDAQLNGIIPTTPEEALKPERVDPSSQNEQDTTHLDRAAINRGWEVPEYEKRRVIDRLMDKLTDPGTTPAETAMCANALIKADQIQFERDHPEEAAKAKGTTQTNINATTNNNIIGADFWEKLYKGQLQNTTEDVVESKLRAVECEQPINGSNTALTEGATDATAEQQIVPGVRVQDTARAT